MQLNKKGDTPRDYNFKTLSKNNAPPGHAIYA